MRKVLFILPLLLACFEFPTALQDQLDDLAVEEEVFFVNCEPLVYDLSINQTGSCDALNADSTRIDPNAVVWTSSVPSAVTVSTSGDLLAETFVSNNVVITGKGTNGTSAFIVVTTF